jgi:hypothetical protein
MLHESIRRAAKEEATKTAIAERFQRSRDDMLQAFRGLSLTEKMVELHRLVKNLGECL